MLMRPGFAHHDVTYATTLDGLGAQFEASPAIRLPECNRHTPLRILACIMVTAAQLVRLRPHVIVTTGALPGVIALALGRAIGARTLWIDSVANAEELSSSGRMARRVAHRTLSQWKSTAEAEGVEYAGSVL
ncbi:MAG: UDP-N-acetylglucosamine--LPS N-acetylglucosamine transferase [Rhodobacteraceae bacterium]|nr:UDP-N-acetylglucosamine--LPS N-acetylglucosamine transferase [Paracoccaceae bacterium]